jgi:transcriptional regulator
VYLPTAFEQLDPSTLAEATRANPFGMMVTVSDGHPEVNHLPFVLADAEGACGTLRGHVAKANSVWQGADGTDALVVFSGPNSYVSPSWYPTKEETARVVPTWNYVVVHARGHISVVHEADWLRRIWVRWSLSMNHIGTPTGESVTRQPTSWMRCCEGSWG